ncbi:OmpA family protein [Reichenbachiella sp.]|uniref:OmpA family protein n=1 Tax=Reichenbachiella sp. TaxID=2184521 RepID=UPI003BAE7291
MNIKNTLFFLFLLISVNSFGQVEIYSEQISIDSITNSTSDELNVVLSPDGQNLYFTRKNHSQNLGGSKDQGDIWVSEKNTNGEWTPAYNLKEINNKQSNQIIGFINAGRSMLISNENQLSVSHNNGGRWSTPKPFSIPYLNSKSKELSASVSPDGRHILFGMESFGNYGVEDIYISRMKADGSWTSPKNLGSAINTQNQEITPFLAADNKTLFFSSNGHEGEGSFDVLMSTRLDDTWQNWSEPKNLGQKVNTKGRESSFTFLLEDEYAYLSSTQNSDGYGDIKKVKIAPEIAPIETIADTVQAVDVVEEEKIIAISGLVKDKKTDETIIGAEIYVTTEPTNQEFKTLTNSQGAFNLTVDEGNNYIVKVKAFRYLSAENVVTDAALLNNEPINFSLEPIIEGNTVTLDHVLFEQGKAILIAGSEKELDLVVEMMKYNPDVSIFLSGHTDNQGKASLNVALSEERVQTVMDYLIAQGVSKKRISGKGFGGMKPIASNASAETRKLNRRVEFTVHKINK